MTFTGEWLDFLNQGFDIPWKHTTKNHQITNFELHWCSSFNRRSKKSHIHTSKEHRV